MVCDCERGEPVKVFLIVGVIAGDGFGNTFDIDSETMRVDRVSVSDDVVVAENGRKDVVGI